MADAKDETGDTITIRVKDQGGDETFFKVKKTTKMSKVFNAYAQRKGVSMTSLRFLIDGDRIDAAETPKSLELEDQDQSKYNDVASFCVSSNMPFPSMRYFLKGTFISSPLWISTLFEIEFAISKK